MNNIVGAPVTGSNFFPRERELSWIWERLPHSSILLAAPRRSGKTSLMYFMHENAQFGYQPLFFDVEGDAHPAAFVAHMLAQLQSIKKLGQMKKELKRISETLLPTGVKFSVDIAQFKVEFEKSYFGIVWQGV